MMGFGEKLVRRDQQMRFMLTKAERDLLEELANNEDVPKSKIIRAALNDYAKKVQRKRRG